MNFPLSRHATAFSSSTLQQAEESLRGDGWAIISINLGHCRPSSVPCTQWMMAPSPSLAEPPYMGQPGVLRSAKGAAKRSTDQELSNTLTSLIKNKLSAPRRRLYSVIQCTTERLVGGHLTIHHPLIQCLAWLGPERGRIGAIYANLNSGHAIPPPIISFDFITPTHADRTK